MKSERPLIGAVLCLAAGLALIFGYCTGTTSLNAAYPLASSAVHIDFAATGPAALGGLALSALGMLLLAWAVLAALVGQVSLLAGRSPEHDSVTSITRGSERILE
jgi:hypothetical protein